MSDPPDWLAALQSRFGEVIRTPLDRGSGTLRATPETYDPAALDDARDGPHTPAHARLAVYNRQYWFRLFGVMQTALPLTARLLGHWRFNDYAARFLRAHPPRHWDLDRAPDGFEAFLAEALDDDALREPLIDAAHIDTLWHCLFRAPALGLFRPSAEDAARLLDARLTPSPATAVLVERWPLLELKNALAGQRGESVVALPARLAQPRGWALVRESAGVRYHPLDLRAAELFLLLGRCTVREALARLEASCEASERAALPANTQRWLAWSVERGLWVGMSDDAQGSTQV